MDTIKLNVPTFIRFMELSREDIKKDETIHEITELLIACGDKVIGMEEYVEVLEKFKKKRD